METPTKEIQAVAWMLEIPVEAIAEVRAVPSHENSDPSHYEIVLRQRISSTFALRDLVATWEAFGKVEAFLRDLPMHLPDGVRIRVRELKEEMEGQRRLLSIRHDDPTTSRQA